MKKLSIEDLNHYIIGAKVLACGGGGSVETARQRIKEIYEAGGYFQVATLEEIPDDELVFIVGCVGGGVTEAAQEAVANLPRISTDLFVTAAQKLAQHLGRDPQGFIASEIGPGNGVVPMYVAAKMGKVVIDGDCCGRAKPEIAISTTNLAGLSITPLSIVSPFGDSMILEKAVDDQRAEVIARHAAIASGGTVGVARCPASAAIYRRAALAGSISRCIQLGVVIQRAQETGNDIVEKVIINTEGIRLFSGSISNLELTDAGGFTTGIVEMKGEAHFGEKKGKGNLRLWFKNEYLAAWIDDEPLASSPDSICVIDEKTGEGVPIEESELSKGRNVVVFGITAAPLWQTKAGISLFGPSHFGIPMKYKPLTV